MAYNTAIHPWILSEVGSDIFECVSRFCGFLRAAIPVVIYLFSRSFVIFFSVFGSLHMYSLWNYQHLKGTVIDRGTPIRPCLLMSIFTGKFLPDPTKSFDPGHFCEVSVWRRLP